MNHSAFCGKQGYNSQALLCLLWPLCHETQPLDVLAAGPPYFTKFGVVNRMRI
jgi:hypothetical protein